ncbi:MAG: hypothetical protein A2138_01115 [Deltaproteobacteria bacterium RBG_16_71_12]|nr:MAG: hypothetical protein A2138_01115 [Deltaproteobacteria bacterium RBG_16_71_12]
MRRALVGLLLACACATAGVAASNAHQAIMGKAVFDLACSKHEIRLTRLPHERVLVDVATGLPVTRAAYEASGCGERADYVVDCTGDDGEQRCSAARTHDVAAAFPASAR